MPMHMKRFNVETATASHEGTILASGVLPGTMDPPFMHQYGYLERSGTMAGHSHPTDEIYIVLSGSGYVILEGENKAVKSGDVIAIPAGRWHTMLCTEKDQEPFLWAALWWEAESMETPKGIHIQRFEKDKAQMAHQNTILASGVLPEFMKAPFGHAYGYIENGNSMELHAHPTAEVFIVFSGNGSITVGEETKSVQAGDVIEIPRNMLHTMTSAENSSLLWAALWWD